MLAVSLVAALALSVTGCGSADSGKKTVTAATVDSSVSGPLTVYTSLPKAQADAYLTSFKTQYPNVTVTLVTDTPEKITGKVVSEASAPVADVVWHTPLSAMMMAIEASAVAPYAYTPAQLDPVGADYTDGYHEVATYVGTNARFIGFAVNTDKTGGAVPAAFVDLIDPQYAGKIVAPSINTEAGYTLVSNLVVSMDEQASWEYLDQLNKNVAYYTDDEAKPVADVAAGSAGIAIGWDAAVVNAQTANKTVKAVWPGDPELSPWCMDVDSLVAKPEPSAVAKKFLDWAISDQAMTAYVKDTPAISIDLGGGLPAGYPESVSGQLMTAYDFSYAANSHDAIVTEWMNRYGGKIKK
jgi:iron(III) transport system substrate-binding protein